MKDKIINMETIDLHSNDKSKTQRNDVIKRNTKNHKLNKKQLDDSNYGTYYVPKWKDQPLTIAYIYSLPMEEKEEVAKYLFEYFRNGKFPYPKFHLPELREDFKKLQKFDSTSIENNKILSTGSPSGIKLFKHFCPFFFDVKEAGKRSVSMKEAFDNDELLMRVIKNRLGITFFYRGESFPFTISGNMLRQGFRSMRISPHTSIFKPVVAKFIYEKFSPNNGVVYDYSMGFGQRLLGAVSSNKNLTYIACDPWEDAINGGQNIISFLRNENITNTINIHKVGSESFKPNGLKEKVDIAFSSAPYFNKEVYSEDDSQAYHNNNYDSFLNDWWNKVSENLNFLIKPKGYVALNMVEKVNKFNILEDMKVILEKNGFVEVDRYHMKLSKSHLSNKVGTDNLSKLESIVVFQKT